MDGSLAEAIYAMGMERNGDIVYGAAIAPSLSSTEHKQWTPNLINFNPSAVSKSISFDVQHGYSSYVTTSNLNSVQTTNNVTTSHIYTQIGQNSAGQFVVRVVNYNAAPRTIAVKPTAGAKFSATNGKVYTVNTAGVTDLQAANSIGNNPVASGESALPSGAVSNGNLQITVPAYSFSVVTLGSA